MGGVLSGILTASTFDGNLSGGSVTGTTGTFSDTVYITDNIQHVGDSNTQIRFPSAMQLHLRLLVAQDLVLVPVVTLNYMELKQEIM